MQERIDLVVMEQQRKAGGLSLSVLVSLVLHALLIVWFIRSYRQGPSAPQDVPIARYVELMKQNPQQEFVEAPGPEVGHAPIHAPLSDRNRRASMPEPTGPTPTTRPGDGGALYTPPMNNPAPPGPREEARTPGPARQPAGAPPTALTSGAPTTPSNDAQLIYREPAQASAASGSVDWRNAIREVGKVASLGGDGIDLSQITGGDKGYAEQGPLSFETQWYDWGDYAQSMVSRIRVNWYANMPQIIRTGMRGVVTIRFTIHRDGRISDITILQTSGVPPYDQAAKKAIELSSPLKPLPRDFPNPYERVTAMFYYNMEIPRD